MTGYDQCPAHSKPTCPFTPGGANVPTPKFPRYWGVDGGLTLTWSLAQALIANSQVLIA